MARSGVTKLVVTVDNFSIKGTTPRRRREAYQEPEVEGGLDLPLLFPRLYT